MSVTATSEREINEIVCGYILDYEEGYIDHWNSEDILQRTDKIYHATMDCLSEEDKEVFHDWYTSFLEVNCV